MTSSDRTCPKCGAPLASDTIEGLCPACLLTMNLTGQTKLTGEEPGPHGTKQVSPSAKTPPAPDEIRAFFPQFDILECLGRGGMGVVYKARQKLLDRVVALKILAPEREKDPQFADRFVREARTLARLNHPSIVTVHDFGEAGGMFYLVMEFVDGVNLRHLLRERKLSPEEALAIVPKVCEALQFAHDQGVVHRDIKPENLLLDRQGRIKIADFGIAKILGRREPGAGETREVIGTPQYMAPEQVQQPQRVDHRADIYSLGVVLYEMLTGEVPGAKIQPPSKKVQLDVRIDEIVMRALEQEPELRYQTAADFRTQVETFATTPSPHSSRREEAQNESPEDRRQKAAWVPLLGWRDHWLWERSGIWVGFVMFALLLVLHPLWTSHPVESLRYVFFASLGLSFTGIHLWVGRQLRQLKQALPYREAEIAEGWIAWKPDMWPFRRFRRGLAILHPDRLELFPASHGTTITVALADIVMVREVNWVCVPLFWKHGFSLHLANGQQISFAVPEPFGRRWRARLSRGNLPELPSEPMAASRAGSSGRPSAPSEDQSRLTSAATAEPRSRRAVAMPVTLHAITLLVGAAFFVFAVPQLGGKLDDYGARLPMATLLTLRFSEFLRSGGFLLVPLVLAADWAICLLLQKFAGRKFLGVWERAVFLGIVGLAGTGAWSLFSPLVSVTAQHGNKSPQAMATATSTTRSRYPKTAHISTNHLSALIYHDDVEVHYALFHADNFTTYIRNSNRGGKSWMDQGNVTLFNQKDFSYRRESSNPQSLQVNGREFYLGSGCVFVLNDDGTVEQQSLFPPLKVARDPEALHKLIHEQKQITGVTVIDASAATFGPVIERVVHDQNAKAGNNCLDLDSGGLFTLSGPRNAGFTWMLKNGIDVYCAMDGTASQGAATTGGTVAQQIPNERWEMIPANEIISTVLQQKPDFGGLIALVDKEAAVGKPTLPVTYIFRTREGGMGVLQVLAHTDNPRGVKLRYKLVQNSDAKTSSASVATENATVAPSRFTPRETETIDLGNGIKMEFVLIRPGSFVMGCTTGVATNNVCEKPAHEVTITKPFYLGKYEVTQEQWESVVGRNPSRFKGPKLPVDNVSWDACQDFLFDLQKKTRRRFALPTEAQWEYACRAGTQTAYSFGDDKGDVPDYGWFAPNSGGRTHPVGEKKPNPWGLYDMHGNVVEWCADWLGDYAPGPATDPKGPVASIYHVARGGCWESQAKGLRSSNRANDCQGYERMGLRCAMLVEEVDAKSNPCPGFDASARIPGYAMKCQDCHAPRVKNPTPEVKEQQDAEICLNFMRFVVLAARSWAANHDGVMPPTLSTMFTTLKSPSILVCPQLLFSPNYTNQLSWGRLNRADLTYEIVSSGLRSDNLTAAYLRCPVHNKVAWVDGSIGDDVPSKPVKPAAVK